MRDAQDILNGLARKVKAHAAAQRGTLTDEQWYDLASRHANADWNGHGYLGAVKALCNDFQALTQPCVIDPLSSRCCQRGTKCCEVDHAPL